MGKSLIIKGADFSENGIQQPQYITNLFTFTDGSVMNLRDGGRPTGTRTYRIDNSINASVSNAVDITQYRGRTLVFNGLAWRSSAGNGTAWGLQFFTGTPGTDTFINNPFVQFDDSEIQGDGNAKEYSIVIPDTAVYVMTDFLNATKCAEKGIAFYAYIDVE